MQITFGLSLAANLILVFLLWKLKKTPIKQETYDATQLMHDLTAGVALVRIERVSPMDVFLRSPKDSA